MSSKLQVNLIDLSQRKGHRRRKDVGNFLEPFTRNLSFKKLIFLSFLSLTSASLPKAGDEMRNEQDFSPFYHLLHQRLLVGNVESTIALPRSNILSSLVIQIVECKRSKTAHTSGLATGMIPGRDDPENPRAGGTGFLLEKPGFKGFSGFNHF